MIISLLGWYMGCLTPCFCTYLEISPILAFNVGFSYPRVLLSCICKLYLHENLKNSTYECILFFVWICSNEKKNEKTFCNTQISVIAQEFLYRNIEWNATGNVCIGWAILWTTYLTWYIATKNNDTSFLYFSNILYIRA